MSNDSLDVYLSDLDIVNDYCSKRNCVGCVLSDYCFDIPTRSTVEAEMKAAHKAVELIKRAKEGGEKT